MNRIVFQNDSGFHNDPPDRSGGWNMTKSEKGSVSKTIETMEHEEKIQAILKSGLALGHKIQDILEVHGIENKHARRAAQAIAAAWQDLR